MYWRNQVICPTEFPILDLSIASLECLTRSSELRVSFKLVDADGHHFLKVSWSITYIPKRAQTLNVHLKEISCTEHIHVTSSQIKKQNVASPLEAPSYPCSVIPYFPKGSPALMSNNMDVF